MRREFRERTARGPRHHLVIADDRMRYIPARRDSRQGTTNGVPDNCGLKPGRALPWGVHSDGLCASDRFRCVLVAETGRMPEHFRHHGELPKFVLIFTMMTLYGTSTLERGRSCRLRLPAVRVADFRLASFLPFRLVAVTESVYRMFAENYEGSFNLTIPEIRALSVIAEHGTLSPTAVGQYALMDKVKVSRATQSLVGKGLLHQRQDPRDGRSRQLRLTRKGAAVHANSCRWPRGWNPCCLRISVRRTAMR